MKVYIAGKITGNDHYREEFAAAEEKLRALGYIPINPAILPEGLDSRDYMRICLAMLDSADAIALLPTWAHSGGAKIELALAEYTGKQVIHTWKMPDTVREAKMDGGAMDVREKLVELLGACPCESDCEGMVGSCPNRKYGYCNEIFKLSYCSVSKLAQHLIANGVTVQEQENFREVTEKVEPLTLDELRQMYGGAD